MPHSSGGGSHGGGFHSSHHSGSHGSAQIPPPGSPGSPYRSRKHVNRASHTFFEGADRYVYYRNRRPEYVYSNYDARRLPVRPFRLMFYVFVLVFLISGMIMTVDIDQPLKTDYNAGVVIQDNIGKMQDTSTLNTELQAFFDETGISPTIITVYNEDWNKFYKSLENYAYHLYVNMYPDERHWVIVYSEAKEANASFSDWYWEGMQGDETDKILTETKTTSFGKNLQKYLTAENRYSLESALTESFRELNEKLDVGGPINWKQFAIIAGLFALFLVLMLYRTDIIQKKVERPEELPKDAVKCSGKATEILCEYCGGVFLSDSLKCPHCGAPRTTINPDT